MLWMGIWVHHYAVIPVQVGVDFWRVGGGKRWSTIDMVVPSLRLHCRPP
jgi:hypothetical protein